MKSAPSAPPDQEDIILGEARAPYPHAQFRLTPEMQTYHGLLWGATGTGKSKLLSSLFLQHLNKGHGVCLIDPHGDLAQECIAQLTARGYFTRPDAYEKLVYLDFGSGSHVPFNVLAGRSDPHTQALNTLEALTRTWPDLQEAPLFRTLFLAAALALIENGLPLTDLNQLLVDADFRHRCLDRVTDPLVQQTFTFFDRQATGQAGSTLRRAFLLSFSPIARGVLGQRENWLDLRAFMDSGVSLIVNLGSIPDLPTRRLIGSMLMVQIEQAALSRSDTPQSARRPWWCLVDEWPSFASGQAETLDHVLSQARKFNVRLYLAAQSLAQVDSKRLSGAFENCHLSVTFRLGHDSARMQAHHIAPTDPFRIKSDARTASQRPQYMSVSEQYEEWMQEIMHLPPRHALVKVQGQQAVHITTLNVPDPRVEPGDVQAVVAEYRRRYQRTEAEGGPLTSSTAVRQPPSGAPTLETSLLLGEGGVADFAAFFGEPVGAPNGET